MFLCERRFSPLSFISSASSSSSLASTTALCADFEATLRRRLHSLLPPPADTNDATAVPLAYLSRAVTVLTSTNADASRLIRDLSVASDTAALSAYLDASAGILDLSNFASAEVDRLLRGRLLLQYAVRLLADGSGGERSVTWRIEKARKAIAEWEKGEEEEGPVSSKNASRKAVILAIEAPGEWVKGVRRLSALGRVVIAVEAVFALIRGILVRFLSPGAVVSHTVTLGISGVPDDLAWAGVYRDLQIACSDRGSSPREVLEIEAVKSRTKEVIYALMYSDNSIGTSSGAAGVKELENEVEDLTRGLEGLAEVVTGLFRSALRARDATVENFRGRVWKSGKTK